MPVFSSQGDRNGVQIVHRVIISRKIVVTPVWTRYVRLRSVTSMGETYWVVEVTDLGRERHGAEYPRSSLEEARKVFDKHTSFKPSLSKISPMQFGT